MAAREFVELSVRVRIPLVTLPKFEAEFCYSLRENRTDRCPAIFVDITRFYDNKLSGDENMLDGPKPGEPTEQFLLKTIKEVSCKSGILFVETTSPLGCMIDPAKPADVNKFPAGSKIIEMVLWKRNNWLVVGIAQVLPGGKYGESQVRDSLKQYWRLPNSSDIVKPD